MAFLFELAVNFSEDERSAVEFCETIKKKKKTMFLAGKQIRLDDADVNHYPKATGKSCNYEVIVSVCDIRDEIAKQELTEVGHELYNLLKGVSGYVFALVGWEVDGNTLEDHIEGWAEEIVDGSYEGFVIAQNQRHKLPSSVHFVPFDKGYDWIPYNGTRMR